METGLVSVKVSGYPCSSITDVGAQHLASVTQTNAHLHQTALLVEGDEGSTKRDELASTVLAK